MKNEINEIPYRADLCYNENKGIILPENVPYLGMGSSFIAPNVFRFLGINIFPEVASDYYNYLVKYNEPGNGVLISQSGESSETLWCADHFKSFLAIINNPDSDLGKHKRCSKTIQLYSGREELIPSKTYINTLLVLYLGFGFDPRKVIQVFKNELAFFEERGEEMGEMLYKRIRWRRKKGVYIIASGPNIATANQAAIILGQVTKMPIVAMPVAQYDHAHKETAKNSLVIGINHEGPDYHRTKKLLHTVQEAGGKIFELKRPMVESVFSPLTFSIPFFYAAHYLAEKLKVNNLYNVGDKITRVLKDTDSETSQG
jgi:glucosamine--fructose-6-phosphate aminotransferase (isomerizing)